MTASLHRLVRGARGFGRAAPRGLVWGAATATVLAAAGALLAACGGGSSNPLDNPANVTNPESSSGQHLSYAYFQRCINTIFIAQLPSLTPGSTTTNTCAGAGCHADATGAGGAFRVVPDAQPVSLTADTPDVIRASDMYKNFYSAQGEVVLDSVTQSRLLAKPLLLNVLHGGGRIFASADDPNAKLIAYWISHPVPMGDDEFSASSKFMFTPNDVVTGTCNTQ